MQRKKAPVIREARAFKIPLEAKKGTGSNVSGCDRIGCSYSNPASDSLVATDQIPDEHPMCSTNSSTGGGPLVRGCPVRRRKLLALFSIVTLPASHSVQTNGCANL